MRNGSVAEWLKAHDSKSCGQQCLGGSNPLASARDLKYEYLRLFLFASLTSKDGGKSFEEDFKVAGDTPVINVETV